MKKVKKQKTYLQKYQTYFNKKVAAVCAMTLTVSSLLSPLATSANNNSNPVYISPVSETQTIGDEYVNVELSYEDIEESQLNVELNIQTNFKDQLELEVPSEETPELEVPSEETPEVEVPSEETPEPEVPSEEKPESEVPSEEKPESEVPSEEKPESEVPSEEKPESEVPSEEKPESEVPSEEKPGSEVRSEETPKTEVEVNLESDIEALLESSEPIVDLKNIDYRIAGFINTNFSFQSIVKKLSNSFSFLTQNNKNEQQTSAFVLEIPIHSSFNLNKDSFEILGKDYETVTLSQFELNENSIKLIFDELNQIPEEFKISFILDRSESIISGQTIVNEGAMIKYTLSNSELKTLYLPHINLNLYEVSQFFGLAPLQISTDSSDTNECTNKTGNYAINIDDNRKLCIDKTVSEPNTDGQYTITLDTSGYIENNQIVADTDIVVVVDNSSSMEQEIENLREYVDGFITNMLSLNNEQSPDAVRLAVVTFDGDANNFFGENKIGLSGDQTDANTHGFINKYTSNPDKIDAKDLINNLGIGYGTNTQMGIEIANDLLTLPANQGGRPDANKYVVLFTDGEPYRNDRTENYFKTNKNNFTAAQAEYYDHFTGPLNNGTTTLNLGGIKYDNMNEASWPYPLQSIPSNNVTFYTIGYFEGLNIPSTNSTDYNNPTGKYHNITNFLYSIQNVAQSLDAYKTTYFTNAISNLEEFYNQIGSDIRNQITSVLTDVVITDVVPHYLDIVRDSFNITPASVSAYEGKVEKTIKWNLATLSEEGKTLSFRVVPNNQYFGGVEENGSTLTPIPTNKSATIVAKELPNGATYPVPTVTIAPVEGGIKVIKEVKKNNSLYNTTDKFSVNVTGPSQLGFEVAGNGSQEVSFYLRDSQTDISYNKDYSKNYLMAGSYSVDEIVSANYEWTNLNVQYCNDSTYTTCRNVKEDGSSFTSSDTFDLSINNHKYIKIIVTNELVNENYWYDKDNEPNKFIYIKPNEGEGTNPTEE